MAELEGGAHAHALDRAESTTAEDGAHRHLFVIDGVEVLTEADGAHVHSLDEPGDNATGAKTSGHTHSVTMPDGSTAITDDDGSQHIHGTQTDTTLADGLHTHGLTIDGVEHVSLTPGANWTRLQKAAHLPCTKTADCPGGQTCKDGKCQTSTTKSYEADLVIGTPILKRDDEQRIITGIVLEPGVVDSQGDFETAEEIAKAAHAFLADYGAKTSLDLQHDGVEDPPFELYESWLTKRDETWTNPDGEEETVSKGTWLISVHATTDEVWQQVLDGELTGFSIEGTGMRS